MNSKWLKGGIGVSDTVSEKRVLKGGIKVSDTVFELKMAVSEKRVLKSGIVVSDIVSEKGHVCIRKGPCVYPKCIRKATFMRTNK